MKTCILLIATLDTKEEEALFLKDCLESGGAHVMVMDTGILSAPREAAEISREKVAERGGATLSFADGHVEYKQWEDPRTIESGRTMIAMSELQPGNEDIQYMYDGV